MIKGKQQIILICHNIRSCHNVGSLFRTAEGLGVETVYLTGYTPYPQKPHDTRLPHLIQKIERQIHKTALGAETMIEWHQTADVMSVFQGLRNHGYDIYGVEQTPDALLMNTFDPPQKLALVVGSEVTGLEPDIIKQLSGCLEILMSGQKESFNVVQAAAMALYHCRFWPTQKA